MKKVRVEKSARALTIHKELELLERQKGQLKTGKPRSYEKYASGIISKEAYLRLREDAEEKLSALQDAITVKKNRLMELEEESHSDGQETLAEQYRSCGKLDNKMAQAFTEAIYIQPDGTVEIKWRFSDQYEKVMNQSEGI